MGRFSCSHFIIQGLIIKNDVQLIALNFQSKLFCNRSAVNNQFVTGNGSFITGGDEKMSGGSKEEYRKGQSARVAFINLRVLAC